MVIPANVTKPVFDSELGQISNEPCTKLDRYATEHPIVELTTVKLHNRVLIGSFWISGFSPSSKSNGGREGAFFWSLDGGARTSLYYFPVGTPLIVGWTYLPQGHHRLVYGLQSKYGVMAYGQRCVTV